MILTSFSQMLPILLVILAGYIAGSKKVVGSEQVVPIVADFFMPALIFISLAESELNLTSIGSMAKASALVCLSLFVLALLWAQAAKQPISDTVPALVFMNSGFLGIPLMQLYGGSEAMNLILIFDQIQGIFMFTLGVLVITGGLHRQAMQAMVRSPILWAVAAGFIIHFTQLPIPTALSTSFRFAGEAASPLAAFVLGLSLHSVQFSFDRHLAGALLVRFAGGFGIGFLVATLFGLEGLVRTVVIVAAALPSAVFTSVLPLRYGRSNTFASTMVITSTLLGILTIPLSFMLAV
ncbi:MAG: AEC family transporter [Sphaerochaeta sp.]|jgi:hypothetical protein|uniref:AEC family transporter n=1 Tax=Sphaerochaeta sp. TaxID=1972642 RepID=UPI002FC7A7AB